ncbi:MAG: hypothetical protein EKK48_11355 [Candidatus Melainabacteria bacterium]|nr:MAG: hypothetical protein EKK48_11355 [Candidatus Melainabacteria bacterium]
MSDELVPRSESDCERVLNEVAMPLFDLRDTSLQALDQCNSTGGDLQSQLLLAYRGSETPARVFSRSTFESNQLGLFKWLQAFSPIPVVIGAIVGFELPAVLMAFHFDGLFFNTLLVIFVSVTIGSLLAVLLFSVYMNRRGRTTGEQGVKASFASVFEPDHIAISPQGLNLQWSSKCFSHMGLVLPWKRIALAYVEEHVDAETNESYEILCIRDNIGKALRLDCRAFASSVLVKALQKRAPWAVKAPPMVLALQPVQLFRWQYLLRWSYDLFRTSSSQTMLEIGVGSLLKKDKYKILETIDLQRFGVEHIAEVLTGSGDRTSTARSYKGLNCYDQSESSCSTQVKVQQFVLPRQQSVVEWYWMLNHFEMDVRRLSGVNSNNITRWLDVFIENGSAFVVTEYDASKTLRQIVQESGPLSEARVREIALEMTEVLLHLHQLDPPYVHGSFTPDALVLAGEGFVKLNQFALGRHLVPSKMFSSYCDRRYASMELLRDRPSVQSDIYSFGCTLYYLLTGDDPEPFQHSNPKLKRSDISDRFNQIVMKATETSAGRRFDSASEIKDAILELANSETSLVLL